LFSTIFHHQVRNFIEGNDEKFDEQIRAKESNVRLNKS